MTNKKKGSPMSADPMDGLHMSNIPLKSLGTNIHTGWTSTSSVFALSMSERRARYYKEAADELYWKSKAQKVIIQKQRERLMTYESLTSVKNTEEILNIVRSILKPKSHPMTSETGQQKTFKNTYDFRTTRLSETLT